MRQIREVLRLHFEAKLNERQIAKICSVGKGTVRRYLKRIAAAGLSWPLPAELDDATLEQRIFPPPPRRRRGAVRYRISRHPQGAEEPAERHITTAVGRTSSGLSGRLQLQLVLRIVPELVAQSGHRTAPGTPSWREDFRRSCRPDGARDRSQDGRDAGSLCLCGRAGGQQLHLRRGHLDAQSVGLVWLSCTRLRVFSGHQSSDRAGQLEERREKAVLLRAGVEPHL